MIKNDNFFSEEKSFSKIQYHDLKFKKHFNYDHEVLQFQIESIFSEICNNTEIGNLEKKLLNPTYDIRNKSKNKVGDLITIQTFKTNNYLFDINPTKLKILDTNIKYIREIKSDGNGFYRTHMFCLLEYIIFSGNISDLINIIADINDLIDLPLTNNNLIINKQELFGIFKCILSHLEKNEKNLAYTIFLSAYGLSSTFDSVKLIIFNF